MQGQGEHRLYGRKSTLHIVYFRGRSAVGSAYIHVSLALMREMKAFEGATRRAFLMVLERGNGGKRRCNLTQVQAVGMENSAPSRLASVNGWREAGGGQGNDPLRRIQGPAK